ncbi:MAG: Rieske 2Fe-2S domain-containing protein [Acidimicrobiaceae bacterium]|nr:Rieske 2Fe-2S domain-containing protein [Acidimicrobiaceae bacterium]MYG98619.1 Rieske 2Fe-2S domain-containing protein [Acidimicrobiaceae bacterium]MYL03404.1 Rieske 2Fe-2S domain-containing protein [Acidimicrobiaceae bacterium]
MPVLREEPPNTPLPSPFPEGWYFVTSRKDLDGDKLIRKTWMGTEIVVWSDGQGGVCVSEAYCPHLGADLGPAAGGRVRDGRLVCGFHGFEYDTGGQCVATPFAPPVKAARLRVFEPREIAGLIFAWWGIDGRQPQWQLPTEEPDQAGWSGLHIWTSRFAGHPQETTENSVDLAHLRYVHGYDSVSRVEALAVDGPLLLSDFDFATTRKITRFASTKLKVSAKTLVAGLGYSFVEIREHTIGLDMRLWILATPVDGTVIDLSVVSQTGEIRNPNRWIAGLGFLPVRLRAPIMNRIMASFERRDVLQDVPIWSTKSYRPRPRLARSDGEIMRYRSYCAQFYPDASAEVDDTETVVNLRAAGDR